MASSLGGGLPNVHVIVTPTNASALPSVKTDSTGAYAVANVPVGNGGVAVSTLPSNCQVPTARSYTGVAGSAATTVNVTVTCAPLTGNLTVTISAPNGATPSVSVSGPKGFTKTLVRDTTFTGITPGAYAISAKKYTHSGLLVDSVFAATISSIHDTVVAGHTATTTVTYAVQGGSGSLWVASYANTQVLEFGASQLQASGSVTPAVNLNVAGNYGAPTALAFDSAGNAWIMAANFLWELPPALLTQNGSPISPIVINSTAFNGNESMAFDAAGNVWVSNFIVNTVVGFHANQLTASGSVTPAAIITGPALNEPVPLAFDKNGTLWVGNLGATNVLGYSPAQQVTGSPTPITIAVSGVPSIEAVAGDPKSGLWVGGSGHLAAFSASQLTTSGSPTPAVAIALNAPYNTSRLTGITFDNQGNAWVLDGTENVILELTSAQLTAGGAQSPAVVISSSAMNLPDALAFNPHGGGVPLFGAKVARRQGHP